MVEMIVEYGQVSDLPTALRQVEATAEIGAQVAKWQVFDPKRLAGPEALRYWGQELGGKENQREMFDKLGCLSREDWAKVARACHDNGVQFMATPFDLEAVDMLDLLGVTAFKIASGDVTYRPLIEKVAATGKKVYLSTGASSTEEIFDAARWLHGSDVILMACDLVYPCAAQDSSIASQMANLRRMERMYADVPAWPVIGLGYSDHTQEVITGAVAVSLGATVLEKHITIDKDRGTPDDKMALTVSEAQAYLRAANDASEIVEPVRGDPQAPARVGARRSAHATRDLGTGHRLNAEDVAWLRPCPEGSIPPSRDLAGLTLVRPVKAGQRIDISDLA